MDRTSNRPLPARRLSAWQVGLFGTLTGLIGAGYLAWAVNPITAGLAVATWVCYVVLYTPLKTRSSWNTAVGAVSGALPMLIGWTAVGGSLNPLVDPRGWGLFLILFVWQFPHFMAIAWIYREQYGQAGLKMTSVVEPTGRSAGWLAVAMGVLLIPISLLPLWGWGSSGAETVGWGPSLYLAAALLLGTGQAICSVGFLLRRDQANARRLLRASLIYLPLLMAFLVFLPWV